jgi:hypothetical protein
MSKFIQMLKLQGDVPKKKPKGVAKKRERPGQFSRCECGHCRCVVNI